MKSISTHNFNNESLLETALTHSSYANEHNVESYERLEFLGDAILDFVSGDKLYHEEPKLPEGKMSSLRSDMVCEGTLKNVAIKLGIPSMMKISYGEEKTGGRSRASVLADMVEAIIAAIYLDGGFEEAKKFIYAEVFTEKPVSSNSKSALQEAVQKEGITDISYVEDKREGPEHNITFTVSVYVAGQKLGTGRGKSKQLAEKAAAQEALEKWLERK